MNFMFAHYHHNQSFIKVCFWQNNYQIFIPIFKIEDLSQSLPSIINDSQLIHFLHGH